MTIIKNVSGKIVLLFFIISSGLYFLMLLFTIPHIYKITNGVRILDMMPTGYDYSYVIQLMEALGETGRHYYLYRQLPIDLVYPFFFAISNYLIIGWLLKKLHKADTKWIALCFLPIVAGCFDYAENFSVISILNSYPVISESMVWLSNLFTVLKSSITTIALVVLISLLMMYLYKRFSKSN